MFTVITIHENTKENIIGTKNIILLEDNCESVGAKFNKKYLGTLGDIGVFSFDFGKNITTGEGGALLTKNKKFLEFEQLL